METKLLLVLIVVFVCLILLYISRRVISDARTFFFKNHVIVIGMSRVARQVALNLAKDGRRVVLISEEPVGPDAAFIQHNGGMVMSGVAYDDATLKRAALASAFTVFIATDNDDTNIQLAQLISRLKKRSKGKGSLKVMLHINDYDLKNMLSDYLNFGGESMVDVQPFSINDIAAQFIYDQFPPHLYLSDETVRDNEKIICIMGDTEIARSFLVENSILSHYGDEQPVKVFLINENAGAMAAAIARRHPRMGDYLRIVPIELKNDHFSPDLPWDDRFLSAIHAIDVVYFFGNRDAKLANSVLHFRQFLYKKTQNIRRVPIILCMPEETKVVNLLDGEEEMHGRPTLSNRLKESLVIHVVRKYTDTCSVKRMIDRSVDNETLAKAINYYYAIKYEFDGLLYTHFKKSGNQEFINRLEREVREFKVKQGDPLSQIEQMVIDLTKNYTKNSADKIRSVFGIERLWSGLTDRKKESNRYVARHLDVKFFILKKLGIKAITQDEIKKHLKTLAPVEHNRWSAEKLAFDFSYGTLPTTDKNLKRILKDTLKIHDQLVPFNKLDDVNKEKDLDMFFLLPLLQRIKENIKE